MRRTYINIASFFVLAITLIVWTVTNYLPLGLLENPRIVTAEFAESPGLRAGYEVTYLGSSVGRIEGVRLAEGVSEVDLAIDDGVDLPADVVAAARRRSAIGEPYVDLEPLPGTDGEAGARLADGDRITVDRTVSAIRYGVLFRSLDVLVNSLDADALATIVEEAVQAVDGRGDDIRRIITGANELVSTAVENGDVIESLIDDLGVVAAVLAEHRDELGSGIEDLALVAESLDAARPALEDVLAETPSFLDLVNGMLEAADDSLICTIDGLSVLEVVLDADGQAAAAELLQRSAEFADLVDSIRDPDDGIFNLLITLNSGDPPVVQYSEPALLPEVPDLPVCPTHEVAFEPVASAATASPGPGGSRPPADDVGLDAGSPSVPGEDEEATGTSDVEADEPAFVRIGRTALPLIALLLAAAIGWVVIGNRRRSDG